MTRHDHLVFNRRRFLLSATALVAAGLLPARVLALAGPLAFKHGALDFTVLGDGNLILPAAILAPDAAPEALAALLADAGVKDGNITITTNVTLVKDGADMILLDIGSGGGFQPTAGKLMDNLALAGIDAKSVTKVLFTHGHPDHLFGVLGAGDALNFPNATYHANQAEWDFWNGKDILTQTPKDLHGMVLGAQKSYGAIKEKLSFFKPGDALGASISVIDSAGHTPGHVCFEFAGDGGLIFTGDAIPHNAVHFAHPEWRMGFDAIPETTIANRQKLLDRAAAEKIRLLGYHWTTPLGHAEKKDGAYRFVAAI